jgi:hypothetical protein
VIPGVAGSSPVSHPIKFEALVTPLCERETGAFLFFNPLILISPWLEWGEPPEAYPMHPSDFSTEKLLKDLQWIWTSPSLIREGEGVPAGEGAGESERVPLLPDSFWKNHAPGFREVLQRVRQDEEPLRRLLQSRARLEKLGLYAQALLEYCFREIASLELLACELPARDPLTGQTLGSVDFLLRDLETQERLHLEFATKVYLHTGSPLGSESPEDWIGPEGKDRLDRKLLRLRDHQLKVLHSEPIAQWLDARALGSPKDFRSSAVIRGYGFVTQSDWEKGTPPRWIRSEAILGYWEHAGSQPSSTAKELSFPSLLTLPKNEWLGLSRAEPRVFTVHENWPRPEESR